MTQLTLESLLDQAFETGLTMLRDGWKARDADGKPVASVKEGTELLKAAVEYWEAKRSANGVESWGSKLPRGKEAA